MIPLEAHGTFEDHVHWVEDSIAWLLSQDIESMELPVPNCPGWENVGFVYDHLGRGLGFVWADWIAKPADVDGAAIMASSPPAVAGRAGYGSLLDWAPRFFETIRSADPEKECFWWFGPRTVRYLALLAATETEVHRCDIADAIGIPRDADPSRCSDGLAMTTLFFADRWRIRGGDGPTPASIRLRPTDTAREFKLGDGAPVALVTGSASDLLVRLWGRPNAADLAIEGDAVTFEAWTGTKPGL